MKPVTRAEALTVCKWLLACDYFEERDSLFDRIILNWSGVRRMKLEASLKHFSPQGMHISDDVKAHRRID